MLTSCLNVFSERPPCLLHDRVTVKDLLAFKRSYPPDMTVALNCTCPQPQTMPHINPQPPATCFPPPAMLYSCPPLPVMARMEPNPDVPPEDSEPDNLSLDIDEEVAFITTRINGKTVFMCPYEACTWQFRSKYTMRRHMYTHSGERPFHCELCRYKCSRKDYLARHMSNVHENTTAVHDA